MYNTQQPGRQFFFCFLFCYYTNVLIHSMKSFFVVTFTEENTCWVRRAAVPGLFFGRPSCAYAFPSLFSVTNTSRKERRCLIQTLLFIAAALQATAKSWSSSACYTLNEGNDAYMQIDVHTWSAAANKKSDRDPKRSPHINTSFKMRFSNLCRIRVCPYLPLWIPTSLFSRHSSP